jgi:hypothetical protein
MNKKIIAISLLFAGFLLAQAPLKAQAQAPLPELPGAGLTPDSPFFFLDRFWEATQMFSTFNAKAKAELQIRFAAERVSEIRVMLTKEEPDAEAIQYGFDRIGGHADQAAALVAVLRERGEDVALLADSLHGQSGSLVKTLASIVEANAETLERAAEEEERLVEQKLQEAAFADAMERELRRIAAEINEELGKPLEGFVLIEDEFNEDVDDDTYSATYRAEADSIVDLAELRDRILRNADVQGWESGDVDLTEDSLDITFEKTYPEVEIDGIVIIPDTSVTISATIHSPERGKTAINYDIDITFETETEHLADLLEEELDDAEEAIDEAEDELEDLMEAERSAEKAIAEAEEEKQELIDEAAEEGLELSANAFAEFDNLLAQAKSTFQAGNFVEAKNLAKRAEKSLDKVGKIIDELEKRREKKEEAEEAIEEAEEERQEVLDEARREGVELPFAAFAKFDRLLAQAKELFARENYQGAKQLAEQAEDALEDVDKEIEKLEKEKEQKEEQAKDEEERKQEREEKRQEEAKDRNNEENEEEER